MSSPGPASTPAAAGPRTYADAPPSYDDVMGKHRCLFGCMCVFVKKKIHSTIDPCDFCNVQEGVKDVPKYLQQVVGLSTSEVRGQRVPLRLIRQRCLTIVW